MDNRRLYQFVDAIQPEVAVFVLADSGMEAEDLLRRMPSRGTDLTAEAKARLKLVGEADPMAKMLVMLGAVRMIRREEVELAELSDEALADESLKLWRFGQCEGQIGKPCEKELADEDCGGFYCVAAATREEAEAIIRDLPLQVGDEVDQAAEKVVMLANFKGEIARDALPEHGRLRILSHAVLEWYKRLEERRVAPDVLDADTLDLTGTKFAEC